MNVLVVIDMQHDFIDGVLGTPEALGIVGAVRRKIVGRLSEGWRVFYTKDTHFSDYLSTQEGRKLPVEHCVRGTRGWEIYPGLYVEGGEVVEKNTFGSLELAGRIASLGDVNAVELVGVCTDICVIANALVLKSAMPELSVRVDALCCAGTSPESHANALKAMRMCQVEVSGGV